MRKNANGRKSGPGNALPGTNERSAAIHSLSARRTELRKKVDELAVALAQRYSVGLRDELLATNRELRDIEVSLRAL